MLVFIFAGGFLLLFMVSLTSAWIGSLRERFRPGIVAGPLRAVLAVASTVFLIRAELASMAGRGGPPALEALTAQVGRFGPFVTFWILYAAYRRTRGVPAAEEQRLDATVNAWLLPAVIDAGWLVVQCFAGWALSTAI